MCTPAPSSVWSTTTPSLSKSRADHPNRGDGKFTRPERANQCGNLNFLKRCPKLPVQARWHWQNFGPTEPLDGFYWPVASVAGTQLSGRSWGNSGHRANTRNRSLLTHSVSLLRDFRAMQQMECVVFGAPGQLQSLAGQEHGRTIPLTDISPLNTSGYRATPSRYFAEISNLGRQRIVGPSDAN
jgi:hypothetical protein